MYKLDVIKQYFVVTIDEKKFILDIGTPYSFWLKEQQGLIKIYEKEYYLMVDLIIDGDRLDNELGVHIDGFIGFDILSTTSLTINKAYHCVQFKATGQRGKVYEMKRGSSIYIPLYVGGETIKYAMNFTLDGFYTKMSVVEDRTYVDSEYVEEFNIKLGTIYSKAYGKFYFSLGTTKYEVEVKYSPLIEMGYLFEKDMFIVGNIHDLFVDYITFDFLHNQIVIH